MSTVPEVIAACVPAFLLPCFAPTDAARPPFPPTSRHAGLRVLVLSLVTNMVVATPYRYAGTVAAAEREGKGEIVDAADHIAQAQEEVANHQEVPSRSLVVSRSLRSHAAGPDTRHCLSGCADGVFSASALFPRTGARRLGSPRRRHPRAGRAHRRADVCLSDVEGVSSSHELSGHAARIVSSLSGSRVCIRSSVSHG